MTYRVKSTFLIYLGMLRADGCQVKCFYPWGGGAFSYWSVGGVANATNQNPPSRICSTGTCTFFQKTEQLPPFQRPEFQMDAFSDHERRLSVLLSAELFLLLIFFGFLFIRESPFEGSWVVFYSGGDYQGPWPSQCLGSSLSLEKPDCQGGCCGHTSPHL